VQDGVVGTELVCLRGEGFRVVEAGQVADEDGVGFGALGAGLVGAGGAAGV